MTQNEEYQQGFVQRTLPWIAGAAALVVFLLTLNQWVSLRSLPVAAKVGGWDWGLPIQWPLFYTLTYPIQFFPASIQPYALNLFAALCAALTIALLARSIALLPHDRTHEQRLRERSDFSLLSIRLNWVPVVLGCGALAFQLTFWENAVASTAESLDILLFAYVIRCLLEFRVSQNEKWLSKMALVYGLGVTNNWAMIGFFPAFLVAVVWIKGIRFFDPGFLIRMAALGAAGLLLYLLLPAIWMMKGATDYTFFQILRGNWATQKMYLVDTPLLRNRALLLSLPCVLPVILMGIRWPTSVGDTSTAGNLLTNLAFRVIHLFFLTACLWIVFDPKYSPRELGMGISFLTFYYLGALTIGYYSGYALLVFTEAPRKHRPRGSDLGKLINPVVRLAVLAAMVAIPAGLIYKNFAVVKGDNGAVLKDFTARIAEGLPPSPAYLLGDDGYSLALVHGYLKGAGRTDGYVLINTSTLESPSYHQQLRNQHGERWPDITQSEEMGAKIPQNELQQFMRRLASSNVVAYLHPSFGYFFEAVYARPNGPTYQLIPFQQSQILPPPLTAEQLSANHEFWTRPREYLAQAAARAKNSADVAYVSQFYSRALNTWGVQLQRHERIEDAGALFSQAFELNSNNVPARLNLEFNQTLLSENAAPASGETFEQKFGQYRTWDRVLAENGPFDNPEFCGFLGQNFLSQSQFRQASLQFSRVTHFQPTNLTARISFAKAMIGGLWLDQAMSELDRIESEFTRLSDRERVELANVRAAAYFNRNEFTRAEETLKTARAALPEQSLLSESLFELYRAAGQLNNAMEILNQELQRSPTNIVIQVQKAELQLSMNDTPGAHSTLDRLIAAAPKVISAYLLKAFAYINEKEYDKALATIDKVLLDDSDNQQALLYKGIIHMEEKEDKKARDAFDRVLSRHPDNIAALRNRAILNLRTQRWSEAKEDYELLRKVIPRSHAVMYGLAEVAYNQKNFSEATRYYQAYLKYAPADGSADLIEEKAKVTERLRQLQAGVQVK